MSRICAECGHEIPEDMDFCVHCGAQGKYYSVNQQGGLSYECPSCGSPYSPGDQFCGKCGAQLPAQVPVRAPQLSKKGSVAIMVALVAGFFNVFGLGHLIMRSYSRGVMFVAMSLIIWYISGWQLFPNNILVVLLSVCVYFYQAMDVMNVAMREQR